MGRGPARTERSRRAYTLIDEAERFHVAVEPIDSDSDAVAKLIRQIGYRRGTPFSAHRQYVEGEYLLVVHRRGAFG